MATLRTVTVGPGKDYSSLSSAEAGEQGDLVALDRQLDVNCYNFADTSPVTFDGWTADSTRYVRVQAIDRHDGKWSTSAYRLHIASSQFGPQLTTNEDYTRFEGLQVRNDTDANVAVAVGYAAATTGCTLDGLFVKVGITSGYYGMYLNGTANVLRNSVILGEGATQGVRGSGFEVQNCTIARWGTGVDGGVAKNCYAGDCTTCYTGATLTTCASSDSTGSVGLRSIPYSTANFVNVTVGSEDLHLVTGSALIGAGTDLSGSFTTDIDGQTRTTPWDIGADAFVATGGGAFVDLAGTITGTSTVTGTLALSRPLAGTVTGTSAATGSLAVARSLAGTTAGTGTVTGTLATAATHDLAGTVTGTSTVTGTLAVTRSLAGTATGQATLTGTLETAATVLLAGTAAGQSSISGSLAVSRPLAGASTGTSAVSGSLVVTRSLAGQSTGTGVVAGSLAVSCPLAGTVAGTSTVTGSLSTAATVDLAGTITGQSTVSASLQRRVGLRGTSAGTSAVAGTLTRLRGLAGTVVGQASLAGSLAVTRRLAGSVTGLASVTSRLAVLRLLAGTVAGQGTVTGDLVGGVRRLPSITRDREVFTLSVRDRLTRAAPVRDRIVLEGRE